MNAEEKQVALEMWGTVMLVRLGGSWFEIALVEEWTRILHFGLCGHRVGN